ncbi:MAG: DUF3365 domain-containing protein [Actinomycetota bacterium]|nr:DUF3365 domain-containing protein [Actinomycetota bacterium]
MKFFNRLSFRILSNFLVIIVATMSLAYYWDVQQQRKQELAELKEKCGILAQQILATRSFIAANQDKINTDSKGNFEFKHLNPAAVVKGVAGIFNEATKYKIKQTRLHPRDINNAPDGYEKTQLQKFSKNKGIKEIWSEGEIDGRPVFRYMVPLYINESCLPCHGGPVGELDVSGHLKEGYKVGDLAGAISIVAPVDAMEDNLRATIKSHFWFTTILITVSISLGFLLLRRLVLRPLKEFNLWAQAIGRGNLDMRPSSLKATGEIAFLAHEFSSMADRLKEMYTTLENKVEDRTRQLSLVNKELKEKHLELERLNQELIQANRYKSEFLANMSHELRTPLTAILAFAELLLNRMLGEINPDQEGCLLDIYESGQDLLQLINAILDFSKLEAGKMELSRTEFGLDDVIGQVHRTIWPLLLKKKLSFDVEIAENLPFIYADREKIRHILMNLLSNAIKFTPEGGNIALRAQYVQQTPGMFEIEVLDSGIGIKKEDQELIFEEFRQVDGSSTRRYSGTGLGLTLVKRFAEMHGGEVRVASEPGKGSVFKVVIPDISSDG